MLVRVVFMLLCVTDGDLIDKDRTIVEILKEIIVEGRTGDDIMFKKVDKKDFKV